MPEVYQLLARVCPSSGLPVSLLLTLFGAVLQKLVDDLDDASAELMLADDDEAVKMQVRQYKQGHVGQYSPGM
jgi:hypothetical protein